MVLKVVEQNSQFFKEKRKWTREIQKIVKYLLLIFLM